jgi:protein-S-isoprenylcysteine O-methyltransferase Ste14
MANMTNKDEAGKLKPSLDGRLFTRYAFREVLGLVILGVALFWSAGRCSWWQAWAVLAVMFGWIASTAFIIVRFNPALLKERLGPRKGAKSWDTAIMSLMGLIQLVRYIAAGLDQRFSSTAGFPVAAQVVALLVCVLGYALVTWATYANSFFSQIVRIQGERGHAVATGGPYRTIRHPGYLGAILFELAVSFLLTSWWALVLGVVDSLLLILRTALEDRTLRKELEGYEIYAKEVRWRLLPGVW